MCLGAIRMFEFAPPPTPDNRQPRCPCVLVLDTSGSMDGEPIGRLNEALESLASDLSSDRLAMKRVEVAIVGFPPVQTLHDFSTPDRFVPPVLNASGQTPLGAAVHHALALIEQRKDYYRSVHIDWYRPWIFLITDGAPDWGDDWRGAAGAVREAEAGNKLSFFAVGVQGADMAVLQAFSAKRSPVKLAELKFRDMFIWLSQSLRATANSNSHSGGDPSEKVKLQPVGWAEL